MTYQRELDAALEAARRAGALILEHYAAFQVIPDAPASISTDTDRQSQEIILQLLHETFPQDALLAEEATPTAGAASNSGQRLWIVDPIDGTRGFARKNGEFSVMIGFVLEGEVVVGVVSEPAKQRLTYAIKQGGCWRLDGASNTPIRCLVTHTCRLSEATITQSHSRKPGQPSAHIKALAPARVIETYSAGIKLAQVARGEADLYLNTYDACKDWDICAGDILLQEAGGRTTSLAGVTPRYGLPGSIQANGLLASNGLLHDDALAALSGLSL